MKNIYPSRKGMTEHDVFNSSVGSPLSPGQRIHRLNKDITVNGMDHVVVVACLDQAAVFADTGYRPFCLFP